MARYICEWGIEIRPYHSEETNSVLCVARTSMENNFVMFQLSLT